MDSTYKDITVGSTTYIMDEDRAISLLHAISREFGWTGTMFIPADVSGSINERRTADGLEPLTGDELDEAVSTILDSWEWRKGVESAMCETGWEVINSAIFEYVENPE